MQSPVTIFGNQLLEVKFVGEGVENQWLPLTNACRCVNTVLPLSCSKWFKCLLLLCMQVCKFFLCGFCPHYLFTNTRADLGRCIKIHDEDFRARFRVLWCFALVNSYRLNACYVGIWTVEDDSAMIDWYCSWHAAVDCLSLCIIVQSKWSTAVCNKPSLLLELSCHMWSGSVTYHRPEVTFLHLIRPIKAGTWFGYPRGMQGWFDVVGLITYRGGIPARSWSPITTLTRLNVE